MLEMLRLERSKCYQLAGEGWPKHDFGIVDTHVKRTHSADKSRFSRLDALRLHFLIFAGPRLRIGGILAVIGPEAPAATTVAPNDARRRQPTIMRVSMRRSPVGQPLARRISRRVVAPRRRSAGAP